MSDSATARSVDDVSSVVTVEIPIESPKKHERYTWYHHFIAGELAGMAGMAVAYPFDTIKTEMQQLTKAQAESTSMSSILKKHCFVSSNGIGIPFLSLYRGSLYPFFGMGVIYSVVFGINGTCHNLCLKYNNKNGDINNNNTNDRDLSMLELIGCGGMSGIGSTLTFTPIDRVKCWSQIHGTNTIESTKYLYKNFGIKNGLLYGLKPTAIREIPQFAVYHPIYEISCNMVYIMKNWHVFAKDGLISIDLIKNVFSGRMVNDKTSQLSQFNIFICGAMTGVGTWLSTYPLDVIKTRFQSSAPNTYRNVAHCVQMTYHEIGFYGFWRGLVPTLYRAFALHSAIFVCYENILKTVRGNQH